MPILFSYGTLQQESVQLATFGRRLRGEPDELVGFHQSLKDIDDPAFVASSGSSRHAVVRFTGNMENRVRGVALEVSDADLASADAYEPAGYTRIPVTLASGKEAWIYADAEQRRESAVEICDVAPGLWLWRVAHPRWRPGQGWEPVVASTVVESGGERLVLDPLAPAQDEAQLWARLDAHPPTAAVVLKPDHVRDVDVFARRYGIPAYGPRLFFRHDIPETELTWIEPGRTLPGGAVALYDGRGRDETPLWLREHRTIVFADALTAPGGELRVWATPWHEERALPALRALLELPFERVIVSHGAPVHDRAAYERALERTPWSG